MNKITIYLLALLALVGLAGCKEGGFEPEPETGVGKLSTARLMLSISNEELRKSASWTRSVELADFVVDILKDGETVRTYRYADMPGVIELPVGTYTAKAHLGENPEADWEAPYYAGESEPFAIVKDRITEAQTIVCKLANVRVTIVYTEELLKHMADDAKVNVVMGDDATLSFAKTETRSGYFAYLEGSNTLAATFDGDVDGVHETSSRVHTDVAPGTHYRITYTLHTPGSDPNASGNIVPGLTVDAKVEVVDMKINVDPGDDDRPGGGDRPGNGDNPDPPKPGAGPTVTINEGMSFEAVNEVNSSSTVVINITSETGITAFTVDIVSSTLTPEVLSGVQLSDHLDLVNPGSLEEGIAGLGLPVNVGGQKSVEFNISSFMPLLAIYGDNSHKFILKVSDSSGSVTKVLQLHMNP